MVDSTEDDSDEESVIIYVNLLAPVRDGLKISKRNICQIEIAPEGSETDEG